MNYIGKIITFYPGPFKAVPDRPDIHVGTCVSRESLKPLKGIPDARYTVRGRSGRTANPTILENHAIVHNTWGEAIAYIKERDPSNPVLKL